MHGETLKERLSFVFKGFKHIISKFPMDYVVTFILYLRL